MLRDKLEHRDLANKSEAVSTPEGMLSDSCPIRSVFDDSFYRMEMNRLSECESKLLECELDNYKNAVCVPLQQRVADLESELTYMEQVYFDKMSSVEEEHLHALSVFREHVSADHCEEIEKTHARTVHIEQQLREETAHYKLLSQSLKIQFERLSEKLDGVIAEKSEVENSFSMYRNRAMTDSIEVTARVDSLQGELCVANAAVVTEMNKRVVAESLAEKTMVEIEQKYGEKFARICDENTSKIRTIQNECAKMCGELQSKNSACVLECERLNSELVLSKGKHDSDQFEKERDEIAQLEAKLSTQTAVIERYVLAFNSAYHVPLPVIVSQPTIPDIVKVQLSNMCAKVREYEFTIGRLEEELRFKNLPVYIPPKPPALVDDSLAILLNKVIADSENALTSNDTLWKVRVDELIANHENEKNQIRLVLALEVQKNVNSRITSEKLNVWFEGEMMVGADFASRTARVLEMCVQNCVRTCEELKMNVQIEKFEMEKLKAGIEKIARSNLDLESKLKDTVEAKQRSHSLLMMETDRLEALVALSEKKLNENSKFLKRIECENLVLKNACDEQNKLIIVLEQRIEETTRMDSVVSELRQNLTEKDEKIYLLESKIESSGSDIERVKKDCMALVKAKEDGYALLLREFELLKTRGGNVYFVNLGFAHLFVCACVCLCLCICVYVRVCMSVCVYLSDVSLVDRSEAIVCVFARVRVRDCMLCPLASLVCMYVIVCSHTRFARVCVCVYIYTLASLVSVDIHVAILHTRSWACVCVSVCM